MKSHLTFEVLFTFHLYGLWSSLEFSFAGRGIMAKIILKISLILFKKIRPNCGKFEVKTVGPMEKQVILPDAELRNGEKIVKNYP